MGCVIVHYHEVALKRGNRPRFVAKLVENIRQATRNLPVGPVRALQGRIEIALERELLWTAVRERLQGVFGVANFSLCQRTAPDLMEIKERILPALAGREFRSFRIHTKRANKQFPRTSPEINQEIGAYVKAHTGAAVDLSHPDVTVSVEILPREAFFSVERVSGPGGLPVGVSGKVACLLSGGIDSPVAAYRMMQRGCQVVFIHFHSVPYLDRTSQEKAGELADHLTRHQFHSRLYLVPFGEIQRRIVTAVRRPFRVILYRRMMLRIAETLARREGASALVTGESLGQVASQTLENLRVIQEASSLPVLRPLIGMDKSEIVAQAERIGTLATSSIPDQDCCQLFVPRHPATRSTVEDISVTEKALDIEALRQHGTDRAELEEFFFPPPRENALAQA